MSVGWFKPWNLYEMVAQDIMGTYVAALDVHNPLSIKIVQGKTVPSTSLVEIAGGIVYSFVPW